jgi:gamma-glutamylcyclotransferase (GGCT)/AIG2-like uncharacterized protein YtfP
MRITPEHLFVYGTLQRAVASPMRDRMERDTVLVDRGTISGRLFDAHHFPALILAPAGSADRVHGELLHLPDDKLRRRRLLSALDHYEGVLHGPAELLSLFQRVVTDVTVNDGRRVPAWIYVYQRDVSGFEPIEGGDWIAHGQQVTATAVT